LLANQSQLTSDIIPDIDNDEIDGNLLFVNQSVAASAARSAAASGAVCRRVG
jgi:hypothetical protein